jgi:glyoxylase-like metal-dependent hydrolase (beta-lactamase superfamily II)
MIKKIKENLWQMSFPPLQTCVYLLKINNKNILIDTGATIDRQNLEEDLKNLKIDSSNIDIVLLTHNHLDHIGNTNIFKNAKIYGSKEDFSNKKILDINKLKISGIKVIKTPGHTRGGVCFYMPKEKILFSGDIIFYHGLTGRTDFHDSSPKDMVKSIEKLQNIDYKILCPGHTY